MFPKKKTTKTKMRKAKMNYEIVRLKDVDNFVTDAAVAVNNFTKLKPEDEIYKESSYF